MSADRRNEKLKPNRSYVVFYETNDPECPKKFYRCFGETSLRSAIEYHESNNDYFYVAIGRSESPY